MEELLDKQVEVVIEDDRSFVGIMKMFGLQDEYSSH